MSDFPSPRFSRGSPRMSIPTGRGAGTGSPWSTENSYNAGEASSQPDSPLSPLFRSSPRGQADSPDFIPLGASSPIPRFRGGGGHSSRGRGKWNFHTQSQQRVNACGNMSFNNNSGYGDHSGFSPGYSPYNTNRSNNFSPRRRFQRRGGSGGPGSHSAMADVSVFYHHSMLEDPWAPLEHRLALNASRAALNAARSSSQLSDSDDLERGRCASASDESEAEPASSDTA